MACYNTCIKGAYTSTILSYSVIFDFTFGGYQVELEEYTQYRETTLHEQPGFPYNTYLCTIPQDFERVSLHWHEQMEIIYIKKGRGTVTVNLKPMAVEAGFIVPVFPGELHSIEGAEGVRMEYENIIFSLSTLDSTAEDDWCRKNVIEPLRQSRLEFPRPISPEKAFYKEAASALDGADEACSNRSSGYSLLVKSQLFIFLHVLYSYRVRTIDTERKKSDHTQNLKALISWVKIHYPEQISVEEAAAIAGYSPSHFMRVFKKETGQTFLSFLTEYRLAAASYYLKETGESISRISEQCGFDSFSYFTRIFRRKYGTTPRSYRNGSVV